MRDGRRHLGRGQALPNTAMEALSHQFAALKVRVSVLQVAFAQVPSHGFLPRGCGGPGQTAHLQVVSGSLRVLSILSLSQIWHAAVLAADESSHE